MKVIHVLRKPKSEGSVTQNVLKHGTGALNIDGSRIGTDEIPINKLESWSGFGQKERPAYTPTVSKGRWPANLILQHLDGCRCEGVKQVKPSNWICAEGCPVKALDEQSGVLQSPPTYTRSVASGNLLVWGEGVGDKAGVESLNYGDRGASRFFKQVKADEGD